MSENKNLIRREYFEKGVEFGCDLFHTIKQSEKWRNIVISPLSVRLALGLTYLAVGTKTNQEMTKTLRLYEDKETNIDMLARTLCKYSKSDHVHLACKLFVQKSLSIKPGALETFGKLIKSTIHRVDFTKPDKAAQTINSWVEKKTKEKIKDILESKDLEDVRLAIVSAIYFSASWKRGFSSSYEEEFWKNDTDSIIVPMMYESYLNIRYTELPQLKCKSIDLPFDDNNHAMIIVLPDSKTGIDELEAELSTPGFNFSDFRKGSNIPFVDVRMPKFRFEYRDNLVEELEKIGMKSAFRTPDLLEFFEDTSDGLSIPQVIHKTFIQVDEKGVEAAAATDVLPTPSDGELANFTVSHPFLFAIMSKHNRLLFLGVVRDPLCTAELFQHMGRDKECLNNMISPLSLHVALGLLFMGSKGKTKEELVEGLHISDKVVLSAMSFHHAICKYKKKESLKINNKYYIQKGLVVKGRFKLIAKKLFRTGIESINLKDKQRSAIMINAWVSSMTEKRINKTVLPAQIGDDTKILIVSSITFKCNWKYHFNPNYTKESDFTTSEGDIVKVQMMTKNKCSIKYREFSDLKCSVFELPFADRDFALVVFFPKRTKGFDLLEQQLPLIDLVKYRRRLKVSTVEVNMPKFNIEYTAELSEPLKEIGLNLMFDPVKAEFSNIIEKNKGICVGQVFNKAYIEINEFGADVDEPNDEIGVSEKTGTVRSVKINRPFLFALVSRRHRLFFWGAVRNPNHVHCQFPGDRIPPITENNPKNSKDEHSKENPQNGGQEENGKHLPKDDNGKNGQEDEHGKNKSKDKHEKENGKNKSKDDHIGKQEHIQQEEQQPPGNDPNDPQLTVPE